MSFNEDFWNSLRSKGYTIDNFYVQEGVGPAGAGLYVVVNGVAMSFADARSLDRGFIVLDEIARRRA